MALLTTASTISLVSAFKDPILKSCKDIKTEILFFLDDGLPDYINSIKDKFQHTKTFLYRQENVNFYDVFFPVSVKIQKGTKTVTVCEDLFGESNFVSIIGTAGSGKTMLMKHFFLESIKTCYKIPLFIELRSLNDFKGSFTDLIYEVILNNRLSPNSKILERLLESGNFLLLLDGYDEIFSEKKDSVTNDIDKFIDRFSKNKYIISSRPGSGVDAMPRFNNYPVMPLNKREISQFIDIVLKGTDDKELGAKIKEVIAKPENKDYSNFLSSPLLLSMFILTFSQYPELPKKKSKFYWNVFDTLATKHDSFTKKGGYQHERKSGLQNEQFEKILQWLSYKSLFEGRISFDAEYLSLSLSQIKKELAMDFDVKTLIDDLTVAISILIIDGIEYKFPHKSIQEYFSVMLIKDFNVNIKQKIYQIQFKSLEFKSTGGSFNLWSLALEIDKRDFTKMFLIYFLEDFTSKFKMFSGVKKLHQLYLIWNIREGFEQLGETEFRFNKSRIYNSAYGLYNSIFRFLNLNSFDVYNIISQTHEDLKEEFSEYLLSKLDDPANKESLHNEDNEKFNYYFPAKYHWGEELENLIEKSEVTSLFIDWIKSLEEAIKKYEKELEEENAANITLLGFKL
ncbi:NACHT domain-containing protein [Pedobacter helvus]|uniref:NACHT domain-containing protein n=1 Tax=Pedobacter helvus TaxID=2563444 RepID=A0ABW9JFM6_9SPHI|nr:NACHT domain-containing protein [Pedobacter ureilyticus]